MLEGKFERGSLVYVLKQIHDSGKSGELLCTHENGSRAFILDNSIIVGFNSNYPEDDLANFLFRRQLLNKDEYDVLIARALEGHNTEDLIVHSEILEQDMLRRQQTLRVESALAHTDDWPEGDYEFQSSAVVASAGTLQIPLLTCMLQLLRRESREQVLLERLGGETATLQPSEKWREMSAQMALSPQEGFLLSRLTAPMSVRDILGVTPFPREQVLPWLHMMLVLGLVSPWRPEPIPARQDTPGAREQADFRGAEEETEEASEETYQRVKLLLREQEHATHYQVLGVDEDATSESIKLAYHQLAREFHPDRFFGEATDPQLRQAVDDLFERIRNAYETLRDDRARREYDQQRLRGYAGDGAGSESVPQEDRERMADISYKQGYQFYQRRDYFNAVQQFKEAVRFQPDVARYRASLARAMMRNPRWRKEAEDNLKRAIELDEFNADYRAYLGILYKEAGMPRKAETQFREVLAWDADNQIALRELHELESQQKPASLLGKLLGSLKKKS